MHNIDKILADNNRLVFRTVRKRQKITEETSIQLTNDNTHTFYGNTIYSQLHMVVCDYADMQLLDFKIWLLRLLPMYIAHSITTIAERPTIKMLSTAFLFPFRFLLHVLSLVLVSNVTSKTIKIYLCKLNHPIYMVHV